MNMGRPILTEPGRVVPGIEHGTTSAYDRRRCRCLTCRKGHRERLAAHRKRTLDRIAELEAALAAK